MGQWDHIPNDWPPITSICYRAGMGEAMPDAGHDARALAKRIHADREAVIWAGLSRVLRDAPQVTREDLLAGVTTYHREAMQRIPSFTRYPEAQPWVAYQLEMERETRRLANLDEVEIAILMSLSAYLRFRGFRQAGMLPSPAPATERCRTAFLPTTDRGPFHIKNVDDPALGWKPYPSFPAQAPAEKFWWQNVRWVIDGVGSGLHIDNEPEEIFPLPIWRMVGVNADDTPGIVQFLERYSPFWGGGNIIIYDRDFRLSSIEKCSHNFFEVFPPDEFGQVHVSGMVCRDPESPQGRYQRERHAEYLSRYHLPVDGSDNSFWAFCDQGERMLADGLRQLGPCPAVADVIDLFLTPYPDGLCKAGYRVHPDQPVTEYTLMTYATLFREQRYLRWQRGEDVSYWPTEPEMCTYG